MTLQKLLAKDKVSVCLILCVLLFAGCKKSNSDSELTLTLSPKLVTALNVKAWTCADKASTSADQTATGAPAAASFKSMVITWKNTKADLLVYAMRITGKNANGTPIDMTLSAADFWSSVYGSLDTKKYCYFCAITKTTDANPKWTQTVTDGASFVNYLGVTVAGATGCGPVVTGIGVPVNQVGDVQINLKATLLAYSTDGDGNVNNEYATFPFIVKLQAPP